MSYKDDVITFLQQPDNLELAFDIYDHLDEATTGLERRFWEAVGTHIEKRLGESGATKSSMPWAFISDDWTGMAKDFFGMHIVPTRCLPDPKRYPHVRIQKEDRNWKLCMGIALYGPKGDGNYDRWKAALAGVRESLKEEGYELAPDHWLGWKWIDEQGLRDRSVLLAIARGDGYEEEKATLVWDLFDRRRTELEQVIAKIAKMNVNE